MDGALNWVLVALLAILTGRACSEDAPPPPGPPPADLEALREQLEELPLHVLLFADDVTVLEKLRASDIFCIRAIPHAVVQRAIEIQARIAAIRREGILATAEARAKFAAEVEEPFERWTERVRQGPDRELYEERAAERRTFDRMLDEFRKERYAAVLTLWDEFRDAVPEPGHRNGRRGCRPEMKALAEAAAGMRK